MTDNRQFKLYCRLNSIGKQIEDAMGGITGGGNNMSNIFALQKKVEILSDEHAKISEELNRRANQI